MSLVCIQDTSRMTTIIVAIERRLCKMASLRRSRFGTPPVDRVIRAILILARGPEVREGGIPSIRPQRFPA